MIILQYNITLNTAKTVILWNIITILIYFKMFYNYNWFLDGILYFQHREYSFQFHMILQKSFYYADLGLKQHFLFIITV